MTDSTLYALILAGGSGTRLWPYSRRRAPKQLLPLLGERSLLRATVDRLGPLVPPERVLVVTGADQVAAVRAQLPELGPDQVLAEPEAKGTAAAVGLGAAVLAARAPGATMVVLPADHVVRATERFQEDLRRAAAVAAGDWLVTFGIRPTAPETGFGYMELGEPLPGHGGGFGVARFVEKPDAARAAAFLRDGRHLWNSGMFVWRLETILGELRTHLPELAARLPEITARAAAGDLAAALPAIWARIRDHTTIDYGVMERSARAACVPASFDWSDVGSWAALADALVAAGEADAAGNVLVGPQVFAYGTTGSLLFAPAGRLVAVLGLADVVVVDTGDALLVCARDRAQDVREIVGHLSALARDDLL